MALSNCMSKLLETVFLHSFKSHDTVNVNVNVSVSVNVKCKIISKAPSYRD